MADTETAVPVIHDIVRNLGGTPTAKTLVPALKELENLLGEGGIDEAVRAYLEEHGAEVGYSVDESGDLSVTLT